ncbi:hypothetical protein FocnCong_v006352 [Fusarium oxysporum f. sp. conglutinans]|nr:hypothetical protein FocnCong_v006352 [Fusarium oxysporum f. sp. conglutinans]
MASIETPNTKETVLDAVAEVVGGDALATISPTSKVEKPTAEKVHAAFAPVCVTQQPIPTNLNRGDVSQLFVGLEKEIPRWVPGSVIKYAAWKAGFESSKDAEHAAKHLKLAADEWNKADVGVTFEWVEDPKDATFILAHGPRNPGVLASAFFPNHKDLNIMFVYADAFATKAWKNSMWKVFMHELGHVLGLRHEFALDEDKNLPEGQRAKLIGVLNQDSVMNYKPTAPELQKSDIISTRLFYGLRADSEGNPPNINMTDVVDYTPM